MGDEFVNNLMRALFTIVADSYIHVVSFLLRGPMETTGGMRTQTIQKTRKKKSFADT